MKKSDFKHRDFQDKPHIPASRWTNWAKAAAIFSCIHCSISGHFMQRLGQKEKPAFPKGTGRLQKIYITDI